MTMGRGVPLLLTCVLSLGACGSDEGNKGNASGKAANRKSATEAPSKSVRSKKSKSLSKPKKPAGAGARKSAMATVPNVVGMDLESAQEKLRPRFFTTSIDITGQGRAQLWDENWTVLEQDPAAGASVPLLTDISLFVDQ